MMDLFSHISNNTNVIDIFQSLVLMDFYISDVWDNLRSLYGLPDVEKLKKKTMKQSS